MSISPTFHTQLYHTKVSHTAFLYFKFRFILHWHKKISVKAALKMTPDEQLFCPLSYICKNLLNLSFDILVIIFFVCSNMNFMIMFFLTFYNLLQHKRSCNESTLFPMHKIVLNSYFSSKMPKRNFC